MALSCRGFRFSPISLCFNCFPSVIIPTRGKRYDKKGGMLPGRKRVPINWRDVDFNPANIPKDWIPDDWKERNTIDYEREKKLVQYIPGYKPKLLEHEEPNFHHTPLFEMDSESKLIEGLTQAMYLTKCVLMDDVMPQSVKQLSGDVSIPNQDERVIQVFRHALLFDIDPKNLDKNNEKKRYKSDHYHIFPGINRYCPPILQNLERLCQSQGSSYPKLLNRIRAQDVESSVTFIRECDKLNETSAEHLERKWKIGMKMTAGTQILTQEPLQPFANNDEVADTVSTPLPDLFPVFPIVDLKKSHVYEIQNDTGFHPGYSHGYLHTIILPNLKNFSDNEMYAQMTSQLFTALYSRAVYMYGEEPIDILPNPLSAQCIASDGQNFYFMCMQLNTTSLQNDTGVKNMVWIENKAINEEEEEEILMPENHINPYSGLQLYGACSHRVWQSPEYYTEYNPRVFQTFLSLWMNGAT